MTTSDSDSEVEEGVLIFKKMTLSIQSVELALKNRVSASQSDREYWMTLIEQYKWIRTQWFNHLSPEDQTEMTAWLITGNFDDPDWQE